MHIYLLMFQVSIISIQNHLNYCQKTNLNQNFNLIQGEIILTLRATELNSCVVQYLRYISINVPSINHIWIIVRKQNFNQIQGELISTILGTLYTELKFLLCVVPYIYYLLIFRVSINSIQKHLNYCQKTKL